MKLLLAAALAAAALTVPTPAYAAPGSACSQAVTKASRCDRVTVYGHRGRQWTREATNENTMVAFDAARAAGSGVETDGWVLADGTPVIFHDDELCRVVDPATLPAGMDCHTPITDLTLPEFRALRMNGGAPGVTVKALIRWSGRYGVPVMLENKVRPGNPGLPPETVAAWIHHWRAPVAVYETPKRVGPDGHIAHPELAAYGIRVGAKYLGAAAPSREELADAGFSFTITSTEMLSRDYVVGAHHYGTEVGNFDSGQVDVWTQLVNAGVDYILSPHPGRTERWLS